jgi:ketosteroid isomerase-like protein
METASYTAADETGQVGKAEQLKSIEQRQKRDLGLTYTPRKQDVRFFGDVALVTGQYEVKAPDEPAEQTVVTEVWVKQNGTWKVEHLQEGSLKPQ